MSELVDKIKNFLFVRRVAYLQTFNPKSPHAQRVLADLARFCRADAPTFHSDARIHAALEGRREVWLRIQQHLKLDPDELWKLYGKDKP